MERVEIGESIVVLGREIVVELLAKIADTLKNANNEATPNVLVIHGIPFCFDICSNEEGSTLVRIERVKAPL